MQENKKQIEKKELPFQMFIFLSLYLLHFVVYMEIESMVLN